VNIVIAAGFNQCILFCRSRSVCGVAIIKSMANHISQMAVPVKSNAELFQTKPMADIAEASSFINTAMKNNKILGVG
jgi:hypothetical protein